MGNFDSPYTEILIGINGFADTTPGAVEQLRQPVLGLSKIDQKMRHFVFSFEIAM